MNIIALLITLGIIIGLFFIVTKGINKTVNRKRKFSYSHRVKMVLGSYLALLLVCVILASILPVKGITGWKEVNDNELEKESTELYNAAVNGTISQVDKRYISKKWTVDIHGEQLKIAVQNNEALNFQIAVERKNQNDDKIEAVLYQTRSSMNGLEVTKHIKPIGLKLVGDQLMIIPPQKNKISFSQLANVFSVNQFTGEKTFSHSSSYVGGQNILYLKIPKDLKLVPTDAVPEPIETNT